MKKIILLLILLFTVSSCQKEDFVLDTSDINVMHDKGKQFDFKIHSNAYMLVDLTDFEILYKYRNDNKIYPASLTKVVTLDTVLNLANSLDDHSSISDEQVYELIKEDASLANILTNQDYTIRDLLYALILPSGADGAVALENYFELLGMDLVEQMNLQCEKLGCRNSHFVNTTGLHDDDHYSSLNDLFLVVMDVLSFKEGRKIMESLYATLEDGTILSTSVRVMKNDVSLVLGGKTGFTLEAGQNLIVLYRNRQRSYVLLTANAYGSPYDHEYFHFDDALNIFEHLY